MIQRLILLPVELTPELHPQRRHPHGVGAVDLVREMNEAFEVSLCLYFTGKHGYQVSGIGYRALLSSQRKLGSPDRCSEAGDPGLRRDDNARGQNWHISTLSNWHICFRVTRYASRVTISPTEPCAPA